MHSTPTLITRGMDGRPLRWRDRQGVLHAVETAPPSEQFNVASWWTRCGLWHLPNTAAWGDSEEPTCACCRVIERGI